MTTDTIRFTATKLVAKGKQGILKPDADGYYDLVIGGLNVFNSAQQYYTLKGASALFEQSSQFMRRVKNGVLKGELGHPKRTGMMRDRLGRETAFRLTDDEFVERVLRIEETNTCCHFKEIYLDTNFGKDNPDIKNKDAVAIHGLVKPAGPQAIALKEALENKDENVCFSIRALTRDYYERGVLNRVLERIVTWDFILEPGIHYANKWDTPALESISETIITERMVDRLIKRQMQSGIATEDSISMALEMKQLFDGLKGPQKPVFTNW